MLLFRQLNPIACMYKVTVKSRNLHLVISTRKLTEVPVVLRSRDLNGFIPSTGAGPGTEPPPARCRTWNGTSSHGSRTVVSGNGTLVEAKMCPFTLECTNFIFNKCPIYTHDAVQVPNFALVETKWITVWNGTSSHGLSLWP
jgi:hypothetical protein